MRLASVSKAFTCAAIERLSDDRLIDLDEPIFPRLCITSVALPGQQFKDPRIDHVTVRQCLEHTGGWVRWISAFDPVFEERAIARALNLPDRVRKRDVARYMYGEPLQYDPGDSTTYDADHRYSNFGYLLLACLVEEVTGVSFEKYLQDELLAPIGAADQVWVGGTLLSHRRPDEARYEATEVVPSAWHPWSDVPVPRSYGGFLVGEMDGGGGLIATAPAVTAFIATHAVWGMGPRIPGYRSGSLPGTASLAFSRSDGIDWCYIFNTRDIPPDWDAHGRTTLDRLTEDLQAAIDSL